MARTSRRHRSLWPRPIAPGRLPTRGVPRSSQGARTRAGGDPIVAEDGNTWLQGRVDVLRGRPGAGSGAPRW
ncbi:MAG TPA: hypothetical protein VH416_02125 [Gaiellaceae bacterium]